MLLFEIFILLLSVCFWAQLVSLLLVLLELFQTNRESLNLLFGKKLLSAGLPAPPSLPPSLSFDDLHCSARRPPPLSFFLQVDLCSSEQTAGRSSQSDIKHASTASPFSSSSSASPCAGLMPQRPLQRRQQTVQPAGPYRSLLPRPGDIFRISLEPIRTENWTRKPSAEKAAVTHLPCEEKLNF